MQYTLGQAKKRLAASTNAYGATDLRDLINQAIQALAGMSGWECLRKILRFSSAGPGFVLPQGCAGLVRACVNGKPTTVRGQDFRFILSGPGDITKPPRGFNRVHPDNIEDLGSRPVMLEPSRPFKLVAATSTAGQPDIKVRAISPTGKVIRTALTPVTIANVSTTPASTDTIQVITEVVIDDAATEYIELYAEDYVTSDRYLIAVYNPEVKVPEFRHYEMRGVPPGAPVELIVETRIDPLPLIEDSDVLPFNSIEPIEWMIRADWQMKAGELSAAEKYHAKAAQWLKAQEVTNDTIQTQIVINSAFEGSPGEISMESVNI